MVDVLVAAAGSAVTAPRGTGGREITRERSRVKMVPARGAAACTVSRGALTPADAVFTDCLHAAEGGRSVT